MKLNIKESIEDALNEYKHLELTEVDITKITICEDESTMMNTDENILKNFKKLNINIDYCEFLPDPLLHSIIEFKEYKMIRSEKDGYYFWKIIKK